MRMNLFLIPMALFIVSCNQPQADNGYRNTTKIDDSINAGILKTPGHVLKTTDLPNGELRLVEMPISESDSLLCAIYDSKKTSSMQCFDATKMSKSWFMIMGPNDGG